MCGKYCWNIEDIYIFSAWHFAITSIRMRLCCWIHFIIFMLYIFMWYKRALAFPAFLVNRNCLLNTFDEMNSVANLWYPFACVFDKFMQANKIYYNGVWINQAIIELLQTNDEREKTASYCIYFCWVRFHRRIGNSDSEYW